VIEHASLSTDRKWCTLQALVDRSCAERYWTGQCKSAASHSSRFFLWYRYIWTRRLFLFLAIRPHTEQLNGPRSSPCSFFACTNRLALLTNVRGHKGHRKGTRPLVPTATATVRQRKKATTYIYMYKCVLVLKFSYSSSLNLQGKTSLVTIEFNPIQWTK